jgi:thymidylate kinase
MKGRFIVVEGLDGVGKSLLARNLAAALGARLGTTPGEHLRAHREVFEEGFKDSRVARSLAYAASVLQEGERAARILAGGEDLVMDRYFLTTLVYAERRARPLLEGLLQAIHAPDLTIYAWLPEEVRLARLQARGLSREDTRTLESGAARRLDRGYRALAACRCAGRFVTLDMRGTPEQNEAEALRVVTGVLGGPESFAA